ncbi:protein O-GlcNAc transferase [Gammaproteobacteria bacterium]
MIQSPSEAQDNPLLTAITLQQQGKLVEAEALFRRILSVAPTEQHTLYSLAVILLNSERHAEALRFTTIGVAANPDFAPLWFAHGSAQHVLHLRKEALASYDQALVINPQYIEVLINSGALLRDMYRHHEALERFRRVLDIDPDYESALGNYGILLTEFKLGQQAVAAFERLLKKNPDYPYGIGLLCYERLHLCDWTDLEVMTRQITDGIREGRRTCKTLGYMALSDAADDHFRCAEIFARSQYPKRHEPLWRGERYRHERLRLAYVSPDLREHPVGHLMAGIIETHDKTRFETIAISIGIDDGSRIRARMIAAFEHFIDAKDMSALEIAELMRRMEVDIAVDLAGYTSDSRAEIFLHRPAPIQVNYLGYPGTMALDCYDYIITDRTVLPEEHQPWYTEKPLYLDHCYLPIAAGIEIAAPLARSAYGLPNDGFIFCAFSHDYKIHPQLFDIWMQLLKSSPDSILWLMSREEVSQRNLHREAEARGVSPERLVFAARVPQVEDHLARYRVADLFLDTWPYNAHTTAADALLAGLPVITYQGGAFSARVAASLLKTLGLDQLVTYSLNEYFNLANHLTHDHNRLRELREKLSPVALRGHPFLGGSFTRSLEKALQSIAISLPRATPILQPPAGMDTIKVAFCADNTYIQHLGVALASLWMHNDARKICVYLCSSRLDPAESEKLSAIARTFGTEIVFRQIPDERISAFPLFHAAYYRILLADLLPEEDKVIYLDCDLIVEADLSALWNIDLSNHGCGGVDEYNHGGQLGGTNLDSDFDINSAVLVFNLTYWRNHSITAKCLEWLQANPQKTIPFNQQAINAALRHQKIRIDQKWNVNPIYIEDINVLARQPQRILHFGGSIKPWHKCYNFEIQAIYRKYLNLTPWAAGFSPGEPNNAEQACLVANQLFQSSDFFGACRYYHQVITFYLNFHSLDSKLLLDCINGGHRHFNQQDYVSACEHYRSCVEYWGLNG